MRGEFTIVLLTCTRVYFAYMQSGAICIDNSQRAQSKGFARRQELCEQPVYSSRGDTVVNRVCLCWDSRLDDLLLRYQISQQLPGCGGSLKCFWSGGRI